MTQKQLPLIYVLLTLFVLLMSLTSCFNNEEQKDITIDSTDIDTIDSTDSIDSLPDNLKLVLWDDLKQFKVKDSVIYATLFSQKTDSLGMDNIITLYQYTLSGEEINHMVYLLPTNYIPQLHLRTNDLLIEGAQQQKKDNLYLTSVTSIGYDSNLHWKKQKIDSQKITPHYCTEEYIFRAFADSIERYDGTYDSLLTTIPITLDARVSSTVIHADSTGCIIKSEGAQEAFLLKYSLEGDLLWKQGTSRLLLSKKYFQQLDSELLFYGQQNSAPIVLQLNSTTGAMTLHSLATEIARGTVFTHTQSSDSTLLLGTLKREESGPGAEIALLQYNLHTNSVVKRGFTTETDFSFRVLHDMTMDTNGVVLLASFKTENATGSLFFNVNYKDESKLDSLNLAEYSNSSRSLYDEHFFETVRKIQMW